VTGLYSPSLLSDTGLLHGSLLYGSFVCCRSLFSWVPFECCTSLLSRASSGLFRPSPLSDTGLWHGSLLHVSLE